MADEGYIVLEDWTDCDKSLIKTLSDKYYKAKGIEAFQRKIGKFIPNEISNSYAHAYSLAKIVEKLAETQEKVRVLDLGCGNGLFVRHMLSAFQKLGILDKVECVLADFSKKSLDDIKKNKILAEFKNTSLVEVDALDLDNAKTLDGKNFTLEKFDLITMNYLFDALPTKVLKPNKQGHLEKLQFRFLQEDYGQEKVNFDKETIYNNLDLVNSLLIDTQWAQYNINQADPIEKKYFDFVKEEEPNPNGEVVYSYAALKVIEDCMGLLNDKGIVYSAEMKNFYHSQSSFTVYGNAAAFDINEGLILNTFIKKGFEVFLHRDFYLNHFFFAKENTDLVVHEKAINNYFVQTSISDIFVDIKDAISSINSRYSKEIFKLLTEELLKIDTQSCFSLVAQAQNALNFEDKENAQKLFTEAQKIDFFDEFNIKARLKSIDNI